MEEKKPEWAVYKTERNRSAVRVSASWGGLVYVSRGEAEVTSAAGPFRCPVRSLLVIPPETEIVVSVPPHAECYVVELGVSVSAALRSSGLEGMIPAWVGLDVAAAGPAILPVPQEHENRILPLLNRMFLEAQRRKPGFEGMFHSLLIEFLVYLFRQDLRPVRISSAKSPEEQVLCVRELAGYIEKNSSEEFSLDGLASHCGLNPSYLSRTFHEETGKPLFEFINEARIRKACQLLKNTDLPVTEVAYTVGYNSLSFFNRYFRRLMDMSPVEYRAYSRK